MRRGVPIAVVLLLACEAASPDAPHALAPLTAAEISQASRIIRTRVPDTARFSLMTLDEPPKETVLAHKAAPRRAFAILYDYDANRTWEVVANLLTQRVDSLREVP